MFKLIVLAFAISGNNFQPVVLNEPDISQTQRFNSESSCKEAGQEYINAFAESSVRVVYSCVKVR